MKFDFAIGNPPYQDNTLGDNEGFAPPVYDKFIDAACEIATKVELIHPARFLFNAGSTPKSWNEKMLNDEHFKVLDYESDCTNIFSNTDIKGGVAITYYDAINKFTPIGVFVEYKEMNTVLQKVLKSKGFVGIDTIAVSGYAYHFTEKMHMDFPEIKTTKIYENGKEKPLLSKGHEYDLKSNVINKLPMIFLDKLNDPKCEFIKIVGRVNNERVVKFVKKEYINEVKNLNLYKVLIPKASGIGEFGETLGPSIVAEPGMGHTETFFSIGNYKSKEEADNLLKYLKGRFSRSLLSILKKTQNMTPGNFKYVPLQDFTPSSDIDWSKSIQEIDQQLYRKYGLTQEEIEFIETNVKEMV
ncbi:Eco57I restriction-modification methylase domain-containing protein [Pseudobutyrivibrio sp.]|uniref:Eco57I restriction-modification methylase domain-containing protein n=1 Tax=Pseudobutyrivibrio sp. TaxID=2014367 RepID=UPI0025F895B4|nr:Eco57I restriction-modification methylase domain-containing protein [Pseudobutyrivibrio sp.]